MELEQIINKERMVTLEGTTATTITGWTASPGPGFLTSQTPEYQQWMVQGQLRFDLN